MLPAVVKYKLHGDEGTMTLQVGSNKGDTISFDLASVMFSAIGNSW